MLGYFLTITPFRADVIYGLWTAPGSCYLQPRSLLDRKIHQQGLVLQFAEGLEGHEFVVGLRGPGVDLDGVSQRNDKELDSFILYNLEMDSTLEYDCQVIKLDFPTKVRFFCQCSKMQLISLQNLTLKLVLSNFFGFSD